jgi:hypothetical protein
MGPGPRRDRQPWPSCQRRRWAIHCQMWVPWMVGSFAGDIDPRPVAIDLVYTITQNAPIALRSGRSITISSFVQGRLSDPEVDAFSYHISGSGMKYRLNSPRHGHGHAAGGGRHPLIGHRAVKVVLDGGRGWRV